MAVLTLADYSASPKPLISGVADVLRDASKLMDILPFANVGALSVQVIREAGLPSVSWRRAGEDHGSSKGRVDLVQETAFSFGNYIDVDKMYVKNSNTLYDARSLWTKQAVKSMAFAFNDKFITGNPEVDPDAITGINYRIQKDHSANKIAGAGLDISPDAAALAANTQTFFDFLDQLLYDMPEGGSKYLITNKTLLMRYWSLARQAGVLSVTKDQLGRELYQYKNATFIDAGYKSDQTTQIIGNVENANGTTLTGGACTSIYGVTVGQEFLTGWQEYGLEVDDAGLLEDRVTYRTVIDWVIGLAVTHPRSLYQLHGIVAA